METVSSESAESVGAGPWLPRPWNHLLRGAVALVIVWQIYLGISNSWRGPHTKPDHVTDFAAFYAAGTLAWRGENIYDYKKSGLSRRPYLYPPTFAVMVMLPLALLPYNAAVVVFSLLNAALLIGTLYLLRSALWAETRAGPAVDETQARFDWKRFLAHPDTGLLLAFVVSFRFIHGNARMGNVNMFLVFLLALTFWLLAGSNRRKGREFLSGGCIALATAFKVTPGLFGLYLLWSRRAYGMLAGALGLVLFLLFIPALALGWQGNLDRLKEYSGHLTSAVTGENVAEDAIGHERADQKQTEGGLSIRGTLMRYFTYKPMKYTDESKHVTFYGVNFLTLPEATARNIVRVFESLLLALTIFLTAGSLARHERRGLALSFGLLALAMLLLSPLTRKANLCALLLPCAAMLALIQQKWIVGRDRTLCIVALAAMCLSGLFFSVDLLGAFYAEWITHAGMGLYTLLLLYAANAKALWSLRRSK